MVKTVEELHELDLGIARFTEFSITVVLTERINADYYQDKLRELTTAWPVLTLRLNRFRTKLVQSGHDRLHTVWYYKKISGPLSSKIRELTREDLPLSIPSNRLDDLFKLPAITVPTRITMPAVFRMFLCQFDDGAAIKFTVQHPLCDAKGLYKIVNGYCDLLSGKALPALAPRSSLRVVPDKGDAASSDESQEDEQEEAAALLGNAPGVADKYFKSSWGSFFMSGITQWTHRPLGDPRIAKAVLIPAPVMQHWKKMAAASGALVSRNDLLMAWIYLCALPRAKDSLLRYTFVLNIESFLDATGDLHNPWCLVPVSQLPPALLEVITEAQGIDALIPLAAFFRQTIEKARSPSFIDQTLKSHASSTIMVPENFGRNEPNLRVSSWSYFDLWSLQFPTGMLGSDKSRRIRPKWTSGDLQFCPAFAWANLTLDDTIVTWDEPRGYWIQGRMHEDIWERIVQSSAHTLLKTKIEWC